MWKKEETKPQGVAGISTDSTSPSAVGAINAPVPVSPHATACISQGIRIKGEVTGREDLFIDGHVEGTLELSGASVTIGPNGKIKADISAREVIVRGRVTGRVSGVERVQLWNTGQVEGEVTTGRLAIEDGAVLRGKVEAGKPQAKNKEGQAASAASASGAATNPKAVGAGTAVL